MIDDAAVVGRIVRRGGIVRVERVEVVATSGSADSRRMMESAYGPIRRPWGCSGGSVLVQCDACAAPAMPSGFVDLDIRHTPEASSASLDAISGPADLCSDSCRQLLAVNVSAEEQRCPYHHQSELESLAARAAASRCHRGTWSDVLACG